MLFSIFNYLLASQIIFYVVFASHLTDIDLIKAAKRFERAFSSETLNENDRLIAQESILLLNNLEIDCNLNVFDLYKTVLEKIAKIDRDELRITIFIKLVSKSNFVQNFVKKCKTTLAPLIKEKVDNDELFQFWLKQIDSYVKRWQSFERIDKKDEDFEDQLKNALDLYSSTQGLKSFVTQSLNQWQDKTNSEASVELGSEISVCEAFARSTKDQQHPLVGVIVFATKMIDLNLVESSDKQLEAYRNLFDQINYLRILCESASAMLFWDK